jgi:hypothetical protein
MTQPQPQQQAKGPAYDNLSQLQRINAYVLPGEKLMAVYDCKGAGTGFVGITDRRVIFYDQGVVHKKKSMVSIPYHQVIAVASADEGVIFQTSEIILITAAGKFSFEFRGAEKAHWAYRYILNHILRQTHPQLSSESQQQRPSQDGG